MKEKSKNWLELADSDLEFAKNIFSNKNRLHYAVHFCHQALEKILKAIIQEYTDEFPRYTHNFKILWEQGKIPLDEDQKLKLLNILPHYIGTKYPEDIRKLHQTYSEKFVHKIINDTEELFQWLKDYLLSKK